MDAQLRRRAVICMVAVATGAWLVGGFTAPATAKGNPGNHGPLWVAPVTMPSHAGGRPCETAPFHTISAAVAAASDGGVVQVCPGTYREDVLITKSLTLSGHNATIDATGLENAIHIVHSRVHVSGFTVKNANGEGVLAGIDKFADIGLLPPDSPVLSHISIDEVRALHNDQGFNGTEQGNCDYPGDCGGGVHLNVVSWSTVTNSVVNYNADGILLTDDYGPNSHNLIGGNVVDYNRTECGIVLPSHSTNAVSFDPNTFAVTGRNPSQGGVYDNVVINNVADYNGTAQAPPQFGGGGSGSGIGIFGSGPGSGAYDNLVGFNEMTGNGLAGFTIHAHHPGGEDVNGNNVIGNVFGTNNTGGDGFDGPPVMNFETTGIAVFSVPPVTMTITGNSISNNAIGIWLSTTVAASGLNANTFTNVGTNVVTG
jgi:nitrous oxidase accessory protein NosD